jgi:hypothetical protein
MSPYEDLVRQARPAAEALETWSVGDEAVLASASEVFRLPLTPAAAARHSVLVRALPALRTRVPVALPAPRFVGVLPDGQTPFTAEPRLPGAPLDPARPLGSIARAQLQGCSQPSPRCRRRRPGSGACPVTVSSSCTATCGPPCCSPTAPGSRRSPAGG